MGSRTNKFIFKLNNYRSKEFSVLKEESSKTYFLIGDLSKLTDEEIVRLLRNKRRLVIADNAIVDVEKVINIKNLLNDPELFRYFYFSKESFLQCWFHKEYFKLLEHLEISKKIDVASVVKSDIPLDIGIKIKFLDNPEYLLKVLDGTLYLKKLTLESFDKLNFSLAQEYNKLVEFKTLIAGNLIESSVMFFESLSDLGYTCNVLDNDNIGDYGHLDAIREGVISCFDYSEQINSRIDSFSKKLIRVDYFRNVGWIDVVKIKKLVKDLSIDSVLLENVNCYNLLPEIKICTEYGFNYKRTQQLPSVDEGDVVYPLYLKLDGWRMDLSKLQEPKMIPYEFLFFIRELKKLIEVKSLTVRLNHLEITV